MPLLSRLSRRRPLSHSIGDPAYLTRDEIYAHIDRLDTLFPGWLTAEVVGPPAIGKSHFCRLFRERTGHAVGNRQFFSRLLRDKMTAAENLARLASRRTRNWAEEKAAIRLMSLLTAEERSFLESAKSILLSVDNRDLRSMDEDETAAYRYRADQVTRAVLCAALMKRRNVKGLLDEGVLKLFHGFLRRHPDRRPSPETTDAILASLLAYPGDRNALFLDAPSEINAIRRTVRGDSPERDDRPHESYSRLLMDLCRQAGWRIHRIDAFHAPQPLDDGPALG